MEAGAPDFSTTPRTGITITAQDLGKRFNREWIFKDLTHTFTAGNTYAITGPNGSGKSTLLQVLWGQMPPSSGHLSYSRHGKIVPIEEVYQYIAIATPYMELIEEFTLWEQLQFHFKLKKKRQDIDVAKIMELMDLGHARDKTISNFSSGMKQRLKLGLSFFTQADIIFLDEPGTNLDKEAFGWYKTQLQNLPPDCLVFIASNQPDEYPLSAHKINILSHK